MKLTIKTIEQVQPSSKELYFWDDELPGYGLRVMPSGVKSFMVQYRNASGISRRLTIGKFGVLTPEEARRLAREKLADVIKGFDPVEARTEQLKAMTVMPKPHPEYGFTAALRRAPDVSPSFQKIMGPVNWPTVFSPRDDIGAAVPINGKRMSGKRLLALVTQNGESVECLAESFTNTHQVFILVLVKETITKKTIIMPSVAEAVAFSIF